MAADPSKPTILIIEDEAGPRDALKVILRPFFNLIAAENGHEGMRVLKDQQVELVTLDLKLPDRHGVELLQEIKTERGDVEVIIITGYGSLKSAMDGIRHGAAGYLLKPFNVTELIALIKQTLEKKRRLDCLREFLKQPEALWGTEEESAAAWKHLSEVYFAAAHVKLQPAGRAGDYSELAPLLSELLEAKDRQLFNHSSRVSFYATLLAKSLKLTAGEQKALAIGAFLHDLGRLADQHTPLSQRGKLQPTEEDFRHPEIGARMILSLQLPAEVGQIIAYHHEWYDGTGYPHGLQGEGIPLLARVVIMVQAFDHWLTGDQGQPALSIDDAVAQIRNQAGSRFDPALIELFAQVVVEHKSSIPPLTPSSRSAVIPGS